MKKLLKATPLTVSLLLAVACSAVVFLQEIRQWTQWLPYRLELKLLDAKFYARGPIPMQPQVVIAQADEKSLKEFGVWGRWSRRVFAQMTDNLFKAGADVVAYDMVWADPAPAASSDEVNRILLEFGKLQLPEGSKATAERVQAARDKLENLRRSMEQTESALLRSTGGGKAKRQMQITLLSLRDAQREAMAELRQAADAATGFAGATERYAGVLQEESGGVSPDQALADVLGEYSTKSVQGYIAEINQGDGPPDAEERDKSFELIRPAALDQFYFTVRDADASPRARLARLVEDLCRDRKTPCTLSGEELAQRAGMEEEAFMAGVKALAESKAVELTDTGLSVLDATALPRLGQKSAETTQVEWQPAVAAPRETKLDPLGVPVVKGSFVAPLPLFAQAGQNFGFFSAEAEVDGVFRKQPLFYRYWSDVPKRDGAACTACNRRMLTPQRFEELSDPSECCPACEQACPECFIHAFYLPSLPMALVQQRYATTPALILDDSYGWNALKEVALLPMDAVAAGKPPVRIPTDPTGHILLNYYGPWKDPKTNKTLFPVVSVVDIVKNTFDKDLVKGKAVVFATTAIGTFDQRSTPFDPFVPGVVIHATAAQNMSDGKFLSRPSTVVLGEMAFILVVGLLLGLFLSKLSVGLSLLVAALMGVAYWVVDIQVFFARGLWVQMVWPYTQLLVTFVALQTIGYLTVGREKAAMRKAFGACLDPMLVDELAADPTTLNRLKGDEREATCMFSDIRGFTTLSENLTPQELTVFLNDYFTPQAAAVMLHKGYLDKYIGDAIMALFGAPQAFPDHAVAGCLAALDMMDQLKKFKKWVVTDPKWSAFCQRLISKHMDPGAFDIGIGLNSGRMRVGYMGSSQRTNYSALGDAVNLASRLEGQTKEYGVHVIISETTYLAAKHEVYARLLDSIRVKGKKEPVRIYELMGRGQPDAAWAHFIQEFHTGVELYLARQFSEAIPHFVQAARDKPLSPEDEEALTKKGKPRDLISAEYLARCEMYQANPPPPDWDGVVTKTSK